MPKLSVIIRTKNEEKYLEKVLGSLSAQTFQDFETIVVDDRSTDETVRIAEKYGCNVIEILE